MSETPAENQGDSMNNTVPDKDGIELQVKNEEIDHSKNALVENIAICGQETKSTEEVEKKPTEPEQVVETNNIANNIPQEAPSSTSSDNEIKVSSKENKFELNGLGELANENQSNNDLGDCSKYITQGDWEKRESALLEKISMLQKEQDDNSVSGIKLQLKVKCEENEILKAKLVNLQTELSAVMKKPNAKNKDIVSKIKKQHEELLTKAKGMIFDKTKMIKNQELQIEALTNQVSSLKEVASITKDLLGIRNLEVTHLQERLEVMDMKIQAEKERYNLMSKKVNAGTELNAELKKEYETQLRLFKELKEKYEEKFAKLEQEKNSEAAGEGTSENNI